MAAATAGGPPPWRELRTASLFTASPPIASCSHLGEHRFAIGDKEGLGWPTSLPSAIATALVRAWVPEDLAMVKTVCSEG